MTVTGRPSMYAGTAGGGDDPGQHDFGLAGDETRIDARLVCAGSHDRRIGPPAHDELERLDKHRLAGTRLARDRRKTVAEHEIGAPDHAEILDVQLRQHQGAALAILSPNFDFKIW